MKFYEKPAMIVESLEAQKNIAIDLTLKDDDGPEVELSAGTMLGL